MVRIRCLSRLYLYLVALCVPSVVSAMSFGGDGGST